MLDLYVLADVVKVGLKGPLNHTPEAASASCSKTKQIYSGNMDPATLA